MPHFVFSGKVRTTPVRMIFAMSGIRGYNNASKYGKDDLKHDDSNYMHKWRQFLTDKPRYNKSDNTCQKDDKRVYYPLQERHRYHIAICDVCNLMCNHTFDCIIIHFL